MIIYIDTNYINIRQIELKVKGISRDEHHFIMKNGSMCQKRTLFVLHFITYPENTDVESLVHNEEINKALKTESFACLLPKLELT